MKALLLALLLANLCLGLWVYKQETKQTKNEVKWNDSVPKLTLLAELPPKEGIAAQPSSAQVNTTGNAINKPSELDSDNSVSTTEPSEGEQNTESNNKPNKSSIDVAVAQPSSPSVVPSAPPVTECFTLGAFQTKTDAIKTKKFLTPIVSNVSSRSSREDIITGYRVFVPPQKSKEAAYILAGQLKADGFKDYFVITQKTSEYQNGISLGLFSRKEGAIKRAARLRSKGYSVKIEYRYQNKNIYWVDYEAVAGKVTQSVLREATEGMGNIQKISRSCL